MHERLFARSITNRHGTMTTMEETTMKCSTRRTFLAQSAVLAASMVRGSRAFAAEFSYKFANELPLNHPVNQYALKAADKIREETGGGVDIKVFPDSQLGSQTDMLSQVRSGAIEFV